MSLQNFTASHGLCIHFTSGDIEYPKNIFMRPVAYFPNVTVNADKRAGEGAGNLPFGSSLSSYRTTCNAGSVTTSRCPSIPQTSRSIRIGARYRRRRWEPPFLIYVKFASDGRPFLKDQHNNGGRSLS